MVQVDNMKKEEMTNQLDILEERIKSAQVRLDALEKENVALRELVHHLATRPPPVQYIPPTPYVQPPQNPPTWAYPPYPPYKVTC
jgi:hypothetical protein